MDVALNHDTHDGRLAGGNLLRQSGGHLGLVLVVLLGVPVAAVDHQTGLHALGVELGLGLGDALGVVVGALLAAAQDDEAVGVADGADNGDDTGLGDGEEVVGVLDRADGVDGDVEGAVGAVLEADGEGETGCQLAVDLRFSSACADGAHGETVGQELRRDGVQHLAGDGHALVGEVDEELARGPQALVDLEAVVDVWVVDETLPADGGAGLLEVGSHDDQELVLVFLLHLQQTVAVFESHCGVMDGAGADDDQQATLVGVGTMHDGDGLLTALHDRFLRDLCQGDLMLEEVGGCKRVVSSNYTRVSRLIIEPE